MENEFDLSDLFTEDDTWEIEMRLLDGRCYLHLNPERLMDLILDFHGLVYEYPLYDDIDIYASRFPKDSPEGLTLAILTIGSIKETDKANYSDTPYGTLVLRQAQTYAAPQHRRVYLWVTIDEILIAFRQLYNAYREGIDTLQIFEGRVHLQIGPLETNTAASL